MPGEKEYSGDEFFGCIFCAGAPAAPPHRRTATPPHTTQQSLWFTPKSLGYLGIQCPLHRLSSPSFASSFVAFYVYVGYPGFTVHTILPLRYLDVVQPTHGGLTVKRRYPRGRRKSFEVVRLFPQSCPD